MLQNPWSSGKGKTNLCRKKSETVVASRRVWAAIDGEGT